MVCFFFMIQQGKSGSKSGKGMHSNIVDVLWIPLSFKHFWKPPLDIVQCMSNDVVIKVLSNYSETACM